MSRIFKKAWKFRNFCCTISCSNNYKFTNLFVWSFKKSEITQIKYYDAKHILISFNIKNKVLLNFKNIKITRSFQKWNHKYYDLFEIDLFIEKQIYRLRLFKTFKSIYNVFYVLLLKYHRKNFEEQFLSVMIKEKKQWKQKKILNSKIYYDNFQYFVKWLKYFDTFKIKV